MPKDKNNKGLSSLRYFERALFVVGPQESGKSTQLRYMFKDKRFGTTRPVPPNTSKPPEFIYFSNERGLYLRLTSPHEYNEDTKAFLEKIVRKTKRGRWNFAGALQIGEFGKMPDLEECIKDFIGKLNPERIRICFLSPVHGGGMLPSDIFNVTIPSLLRLDDRIECCTIDANYDHGLFLADFIDFT